MLLPYLGHRQLIHQINLNLVGWTLMMTCRDNEPIEPYVATKWEKLREIRIHGQKRSYGSQSSLVELVSECSQYHLELPLSTGKIPKNQKFFGFSKNAEPQSFRLEVDLVILILRQLTMTDS